MFQFPRFPSTVLCVQTGMTGHYPSRVSPFGHPRIKAWSTAPRGFSQPPTSFIGIWRQGIHRWLFVAWDVSSCTVTRCSCSLCSSQGTRQPFRHPAGALEGPGPARGARDSRPERNDRRRDCAAASPGRRRDPPRSKERNSFTTEQERPAVRDPVVPVLTTTGVVGFGGSDDPNCRIASDRRRSARS